MAESNAKAAAVTQQADREFVISRVFDAPREIVFAAWTDPRHIARWWGPRVFTNNFCEMDARPGGAYRIVMQAPHGTTGFAGAGYPITGVFREFVKPERLVMTMDVSGHPREWHDLIDPNRAPGDNNPAGDILCSVTFEDVQGNAPGNTKVTVRMLFKSVAVRDAMVKMGMNEGWSQSLDRLGELLEKLNKNQGAR